MSKATSTPTTSRRTVMVGAIALAAGSAVNVAAIVNARATDPVFAAIEHHQQAYQRWSDSIEADEDNSSLSRPHVDAVWAFVRTVPTTLPGVIASLVHVQHRQCAGGLIDYATETYGDPRRDHGRSILTALRQLAVQS